MRHDREKLVLEPALDAFKAEIAQRFAVREDDTEAGYNVYDIKRDSELKKLFNEIASAEFVVTDRLHGMIFCAITGTPCIVLNNYNHKIKSTYDSWLKAVDYIEFVEDISQINLDKIIEKFKKSTFKWKSLDAEFEELVKEL